MPSIQNVKKLLIAPLDWGLGHTTRCIPIIRYLLQKNCQIWVAGNELQINILKEEFPSVTFIELEGYNISYPKKPGLFVFKILIQIPKLILAIRREHRWLKIKQDEHGWEYIISDQRFGLFSGKTKSAFITHQLSIQSGFSELINNCIRYFNYKYIRRFNQCWIPDISGELSLAGKLSHPAKYPGNERYIGFLSRFQQNSVVESFTLLVIISGPEPQRTIFEELIFSQVNTLTEKITIIRGLPGAEPAPFLGNHVTIHNHLPSSIFEKQLASASMVLCRAGYSGIMDLIALGKKAILVPTPGQTEQEYLAERLKLRGQFYIVKQDQLFLPGDLEKAAMMSPKKYKGEFETYQKAVDEFLSSPEIT